ncbi:MAG: hypothetical protein ACLRIP_13670 [Blautia massiliensis (ex Durand et al. 2017)]
MADEKIMPENGLESTGLRKISRGIIKFYTLMSDIFMRNVFQTENAWNMFCRSLWKNRI